MTALAPASVTKAVTALYALDTLGRGHRFATRLLAAGPVEDGVLRGDLVLAGGGDPTLDTDALADMAAGLKRAGVREVTGAFRVWGGAVPYRAPSTRASPSPRATTRRCRGSTSTSTACISSGGARATAMPCRWMRARGATGRT